MAPAPVGNAQIRRWLLECSDFAALRPDHGAILGLYAVTNFFPFFNVLAIKDTMAASDGKGTFETGFVLGVLLLKKAFGLPSCCAAVRVDYVFLTEQTESTKKRVFTGLAKLINVFAFVIIKNLRAKS